MGGETPPFSCSVKFTKLHLDRNAASWYDGGMTNDAHEIAYGVIEDLGEMTIEEYRNARTQIAEITDSAILYYIDLHFEFCAKHSRDLNDCSDSDSECAQMRRDAWITDNELTGDIILAAHMHFGNKNMN